MRNTPPTFYFQPCLLLFLLSLCLCLPLYAQSTHSSITDIDDSPGLRDLQHPEWFSDTFLDLKEDLNQAKKEGKTGIIVYFGQKDCGYCQALLEVNFGKEKDIVKYTQEHFNVIAIDIWGSREVTDMDGTVYTETEFAEEHSTHFTPTLFFYTDYTDNNEETLRLNGYYQPYQFKGALEFIVDGYYKKEALKEYLDRADPPGKFEMADINSAPFFTKPPYIFDRSHFASSQPLIVFFERRNCHACDILHTQPVYDAQVQKLLKKFEVAQLDIDSDTRIITPSGKKMTAKQWSKKLKLFYTPTLVFFDEKGKEIIRVDSVVRLYRLRGVLDYVSRKAYINTPTFQRWRENLQQEEL